LVVGMLSSGFSILALKDDVFQYFHQAGCVLPLACISPKAQENMMQPEVAPESLAGSVWLQTHGVVVKFWWT